MNIRAADRTLLPDLLRETAQRMGTDWNDGAFWFEVQDAPPVTVEYVAEPPAVILHATLGEAPTGGEHSTYSLLGLNNPSLADAGAYVALAAQGDDTLLLFHRMEPAELGSAEDAIQAMLRFAGTAGRAAARWNQADGLDDGDQAEARPVGATEDTPLLQQQAHRERFALAWSDLLNKLGLEDDGPAQNDDSPRSLETDSGAMLHLECEPARGTVLLSAVLAQLPLDDDAPADEEDDHPSLRPLLRAHLEGVSTAGGVFGVNADDELVLHRRVPLEGLEGGALGDAALALAGAAAYHAQGIGLGRA
jgi:hypothetical protein